MKFRSRWAGAVLFSVALGSTSLAHAVPVSGQGTWETTLQARDFDGNTATIEAYYDTALNITWLANANYVGTTMDWAIANTWAAGLNVNGVTGWRLPKVAPVNGTTFNTSVSYNGSTDSGLNISAPGSVYADSTSSEMAHLFYNTLGNKTYCAPSSVWPTCTAQTGWGLSNSGPFENVSMYYYWSDTEVISGSIGVWDFNFLDGSQDVAFKSSPGIPGASLLAWAVHPGDVGTAVATVPVPTAVWLFGSGLTGLIGFVRRKARVV